MTSAPGGSLRSLSPRAMWAIHFAMAIGPFILWAIARNRPPWGDEVHFLQTVRLFGQGVTLDLLRSYPEMSGPLTYLIYAAWGHVVGFGTPELRLLSPVVASATALTWFRVLGTHLCSVPLLLLSCALIVLNPYFIGLSVFVFTDMLALLGLALVALGVGRRAPWLIAVGVAGATCARQHLAFLAVALLGTALLSRDRTHNLIRLAVPAAIGMAPLTLLVLLWRGHLAPANDLRDTYVSEGFRFDPHALILYLSVPAAYLLPLVLLTVRRLSRRAIVAAALLGLGALIFPVQPSLAQTREGFFTVGFLHRAVDSALPDVSVVLLFVLLTALNGAALIRGATDAAARWRLGTLQDPELFAWLGVAAFLLVMPFSYMPWEKYALPLLMMQGAALAMFLDRDRPAYFSIRR